MDAITLQNEIDKARMNPAFAGLSDSQIRDMLLGSTDVYGQNLGNQEVAPQQTQEIQPQQTAVETNMSWDNPYEYQGPASIGEDASMVASKVVGKGYGKALAKSGIVQKGLQSILGSGTPLTMGPPTMAQAAGTGLGAVLKGFAASPIAPLAIGAALLYGFNKRKKKRRERERKRRLEQYQDFRETERNKLREGQQDYFEMAGKYSNPYNV